MSEVARKEPEININVNLHYPYNDKFEYKTVLERIDLDAERIKDIKSGKGFAITTWRSIKKDIKDQDGIFSSRWGHTFSDASAFVDKYKCKNGCTRGAIYHGMKCPVCGHIVKYTDDDMSIFGWIILKEPYYLIHPNIYTTLEAFIGTTRLDAIINPKIDVDQDGKIIENPKLKKDEPYRGIGILEFREKYDEVLKYYLKKYPQKKIFYDDLMANKNITFTHSVPVFTTLLRPTKLDNAGLKYEKTNENYNMINRLVAEINKDGLHIFRKKKTKYEHLYEAQFNFNAIYTELRKILAGKKGDIRASIGGRFSFSSRSVIIQDPKLKPDQVKLPYHGLCELLQQRIINILVKTYQCTYANAYKKWYKAQIGYDQIIYDIIDNLIKDSDGGLDVIINRNPTINFGGIMAVKVIGINNEYVMSISLQILKKLAADFDGDTLNILWLANQDFIRVAQKTISPRNMFISRNDGQFDNDLNFARDTIINANGMKSICKYTLEQIQRIKKLQQM